MSSGPAVEICVFNQEISTGAAEATSLSLPVFRHGCTDFAFRFHRKLQPWQLTLAEKIKYRESCPSIQIWDICRYIGNLKTSINLYVYRVLSNHTCVNKILWWWSVLNSMLCIHLSTSLIYFRVLGYHLQSMNCFLETWLKEVTQLYSSKHRVSAMGEAGQGVKLTTHLPSLWAL
jgi:hypothetical protein